MNGRTRIELPAHEAKVIISNTILGYIKDGKPVREAVQRTMHDLGVQIPEDRMEWLIKYYEDEIIRLRTAQDNGLHVAGGQVVEVVKHVEEVPGYGRRT